jgi:phage gpG-like protein
MSVSGSGTKELVQVIADFNRVRDRSVLRQVNQNIAEEALSLVQRGFQTTTNPYGQAWAPAKYRAGVVLSDKRRLRNSYTIGGVSPDGFRIGTNAKYAKTHQYGATIVPKTAKMLAFQIQIGTRVKRGGGKGSAIKGWIFAKKVVIPARQMMPEGSLPQTWSDAFVSTADEVLRTHFQQN